MGWLPVVHFCFSDTRINYWITVISYLKRARTGRRVLFHNCSLKLQCAFRFLGLIEHITCHSKKDFRLQVRMQGSYEAVEMSDQAGPETIEVTVYHFNI